MQGDLAEQEGQAEREDDPQRAERERGAADDDARREAQPEAGAAAAERHGRAAEREHALGQAVAQEPEGQIEGEAERARAAREPREGEADRDGGERGLGGEEGAAAPGVVAFGRHGGPGGRPRS